MVIEAVGEDRPKRITQPWTEDRLSYLYKSVGHQAPHIMANHLGISLNSLRHKVTREGLSLRSGEGWANVAEVAQQKDLSEGTLLKYVKAGIIPARKVGAVWVIEYGQSEGEKQSPFNLVSPNEHDESDESRRDCRNCGNHLVFGLIRSCSIFCEEEYAQEYYWESIFGTKGSDRLFKPYYRRNTQDFLAREGVDLMVRDRFFVNFGTFPTKINVENKTAQEALLEEILRDEFPGYVVPVEYLKTRLPRTDYHGRMTTDNVVGIFNSLRGKLVDPTVLFQVDDMGFAAGLTKFDITEEELKFLRQILIREGTDVPSSVIMRNLGIRRSTKAVEKILDTAERFNDRLMEGGAFRLAIQKRGKHIWKGGFDFSLQRL